LDAYKYTKSYLSADILERLSKYLSDLNFVIGYNQLSLYFIEFMGNNQMKVSLLTDEIDHYQMDLLTGLISQEIKVDFISGYLQKDRTLIEDKRVHYYIFGGTQNPNLSLKEKIIRILNYYVKLILYAARTNSKVFHIQWLNKFVYFDRTLLNIYYKIIGKNLVFTAHNVNAAQRDGNDTLFNKLSLKFMYRIVDHIIVHTETMKKQLLEDFGINEHKISVIPMGINTSVYKSDMTRMQARRKINLKEDEKVLLFFGNILPYKGLEYAILTLYYLRKKHNNLKLIIAGQVSKNAYKYWQTIQELIKKHELSNSIIKKIGRVPDNHIEIYCKSADVMLLPYKHIFQSAVLFLSYSFGLPAIAADVGSLKEDIIQGKTGFVCKPEDPDDLAEKIDLYFQSDLFKNLNKNRRVIMKYANEKYSWGKVGETTLSVYNKLLYI
jgi:D-inositol-3-phosphate glycosyltransferase